MKFDWRYWWHRKGAAEAAEGLASAASDLDQLNRSTEQDFLTAGNRLEQFRAETDRLGAQLGELVGCGAGDDSERTAGTLDEVLALVAGLNTSLQSASGSLEAVRQSAERARGEIANFHQTVSTFRLVGVLTRIETARLEGQGSDFGHLADQVQHLAARIEESVQGAMTTSGSVCSRIVEALEELSCAEARESAQLPELSARVSAGIQALEAASRAAAEVSARHAREYDAAGRSIGEVVVALQFQDITRQRLEHVAQVLRRAGAPPDGKILELQVSQLEAAGRDFANSAASLRRNLESVGAQVREMAAESRESIQSKTSGTGGDSLRASIGRIVVGLRTCAQGQDTVRVLNEEIQQMIAEIRGAVARIVSIDLEMQRLALNAGIRAVHIGGSGDALGCLADSMRSLAAAAGERSARVLEALDGLSHSAGELGDSVGAHCQIPENLFARLQQAVAEIEHRALEAGRREEKVAAEAAGLCAAIDQAASEFTVDRAFGEQLDALCARLRAIRGSGYISSGADDLSHAYTMEAQREIHRSVMGEETEKQPVAVSSGGELLDSNVELF